MSCQNDENDFFISYFAQKTGIASYNNEKNIGKITLNDVTI